MGRGSERGIFPLRGGRSGLARSRDGVCQRRRHRECYASHYGSPMKGEVVGAKGRPLAACKRRNVDRPFLRLRVQWPPVNLAFTPWIAVTNPQKGHQEPSAASKTSKGDLLIKVFEIPFTHMWSSRIASPIIPLPNPPSLHRRDVPRYGDLVIQFVEDDGIAVVF